MPLKIFGPVPGVIPEAFEFEVGPDYAGRYYDRFYAERDHSGPGWYIFGRNPQYGGRLIRLIARPNVKPRVHPHYNIKIRRGFRTRREAEMVVEFLNKTFPEGNAL